MSYLSYLLPYPCYTLRWGGCCRGVDLGWGRVDQVFLDSHGEMHDGGTELIQSSRFAVASVILDREHPPCDTTSSLTPFKVAEGTHARVEYYLVTVGSIIRQQDSGIITEHTYTGSEFSRTRRINLKELPGVRQVSPSSLLWPMPSSVTSSQSWSFAACDSTRPKTPETRQASVPEHSFSLMSEKH